MVEDIRVIASQAVESARGDALAFFDDELDGVIFKTRPGVWETIKARMSLFCPEVWTTEEERALQDLVISNYQHGATAAHHMVRRMFGDDIPDITADDVDQLQRQREESKLQLELRLRREQTWFDVYRSLQTARVRSPLPLEKTFAKTLPTLCRTQPQEYMQLVNSEPNEVYFCAGGWDIYDLLTIAMHREEAAGSS